MNTTATRKLTSIRLNSNLYEHLQKLAKKDNRSFNNYVETLLSSASNYLEPSEETRLAMKESRKEHITAQRFNNVNDLVKSLSD